MSTKANDLEKEIMNYLTSYAEDIENEVINETHNITKQALEDLKQASPRGKNITGKQTRDGPYWKGWKRQTGKTDLKSNRYTIKIHNATNYQLTHLLEFGHATRSGSSTKKYPHIRPIEEKYSSLYEKELSTAIKRRSKKK